jgi:hypothetical protein
VNLPGVDALLGVSRTRILAILGDPGCGRWNEAAGAPPAWVSVPCAEAERLRYAFYYLPGTHLGGGPELVLSFDEHGTCTAARWLHSQ